MLAWSFQSPDDRLKFLKTRFHMPQLAQDERNIWVDREKTEAEHKKSKSISKPFKILKSSPVSDKLNKDMIDRVYGHRVVLLKDEAFGRWVWTEQRFDIDIQESDWLAEGFSGEAVLAAWKSEMSGKELGKPLPPSQYLGQ